MSDEKLLGEAVSAPPTLAAQTETEIANQAVALLQQGEHGRESAALLLYRNFGRCIMHYFIRNRVPQIDAEELVTNVIVKFIDGGINKSKFDASIDLMR